ncbi:hypothetical protein HJFPF1_06956 [Paramyrothecium foliicola]|nr:hypothetical protein HJFPF1_06956 [Paramyrothecium foliicola]
MSLNGLDAAPVLEAHEAVAAEPGGWIILKYASRDEVELLSRGTGGVVEVRKAITEYEETSPLYGFLKYRRRNVVLKYLPDGCSRLIQARVAVHFNAVCERFSPYDTTFEITQADELKDSKLSAACSLHAASGSNASSSSSLRRRRLMEIAEEEEEEPRATKRKSAVLEDGDDEEPPKSPAAPAEPVTLNSDLATSPEHTKFSAASTSEVPKFVGVDDAPTSPTESTRTSFQSSRPDLLNYSSQSYSKPRVKLGPRPSADANIRPQTAGNFQPVSSIPAGVKLFGKGHRKAKSRDPSEAALPSPAASAAGLPTVPLQAPAAGESMPSRPGTSSGFSIASSIMTGPTTVGTNGPPTKQTITPEKARLMKAMQLREKKKLKMMNEGTSQPALSPELTDSRIKAGSESPQFIEEPAVDTPETSLTETEYQTSKASNTEPESEISEAELTVAKRHSITKADSGVILENVSVSSHDQASEPTLSDSRAHSPTLASSEVGESTKASSLSGSTDETVHAKEDEPVKGDLQDDVQSSGEPEKTALQGTDHLAPQQIIEPLQREGIPEAQSTDEATTTKLDEVTSEDSKIEKTVGTQRPHSDASQLQGHANNEPETGEIIIQLPMEERLHVQDASGKNLKALPTVETREVSVDHELEDNNAQEAGKDESIVAERPELSRKMTIPISKFSANGTKPISSQETRPSVEIPQTSPNFASSTTTPTNEAPSPPRGTPKSKPSTHDLRAAAKAASQTSLPPPLPQSPQDDGDDAAPEQAVLPQDQAEPVEKDLVAGVSTPIIKEDFASERSVAIGDKDDAVTDVGEIADDEEDNQDTGVNTGATSPYHPTEFDKEQPIKLPFLSILTDRPPNSRSISRTGTEPGTETHLSEDDELMDELQSATVQEATSMTVAKTPVSPVFPSTFKGPPPSPGHTVRTVSNPMRASMIMPTDVSQSSARSVSSGAAYLHKVTQQQTNGNLTKKGTVGSSISQRIKALERLSVASTDSVPSVARVGRERPQSTFFSVKKSREPSRSPSVVDRASPFTRQTSTEASTPTSRDHSPDVSKARERDRSLSVASRLSMFESPPRPSTATLSPPSVPRGRPESVSVTAKIVRDPKQTAQKNLEPPKDPANFAPLDFKQSPLLVDHHKAQAEDDTIAADVAIIDSPVERRMSKDSHKSDIQDAKENRRRSSLTIVRDFIKERRKSVTSSTAETLTSPHPGSNAQSSSRPPSAHQNHGVGSRLSISSRHSFSKDRDHGISPTGMTESSVSGDESKSSSGDNKKKSRTGRWMRRLSELSSSRGKVASHAISPAVTEEEIPEPVVAPRPSTTNTPAIVSDMGDVNVQFPDNLLWKRRNMRLDAQGFLTLSAPPGAVGARALAQGTKRYHLSDFRQPYIPDVEVQELPNSVVLDLVDGSGVQIACEDRTGQVHVLQILQEAHAAHAAVFGR